MATGDRDLLKEAIDQTTIDQCWELVPMAGPAPARDGLIRSPFREDKKPSFSLSGGLRFWKDFSSGDRAQGVWGFVKAARPDWEKGAIARYFLEKQGLWEQSQNQKGPSKTEQRERYAEERRRAAQMARDRRKAELRITRADGSLPEWPDFVRDRFMEVPEDVKRRLKELAKRRGWPVEWVEYLYHAERLSFPRNFKDDRFAALTVEAPEQDFKKSKVIGYHQQFFVPPEHKGWMFFPYSPKKPVTRGDSYYAQCCQWAKLKGKGPGEPMVPPLPFVLGNPAQAQLWIITEGQWDAITLWGVLGGFDDPEMCADIAIFGVRGVSGADCLLRYFFGALSRYKPQIWIFADNDKASWKWDNKGFVSRDGRLPPVCFVDRLKQVLNEPSARIPVTRIKPEMGKDANDWYKTGRLTREVLLTLIEEMQRA